MKTKEVKAKELKAEEVKAKEVKAEEEKVEKVKDEDKYSICIIDDKFPVLADPAIDEKRQLTKTDFNLMLKDGVEWGDYQLKTLISEIIEKTNFSVVSGFANPNIYDNSTDLSDYFPDIIIFDWDYGTGESEELFNIVLNKSFALICIYSGSDKIDEIKAIIDQEKYKQFINRISVFDKSKDNLDIIVKLIEDKCKTYFSFQYRKLLRKFTMLSLEKILFELGKSSVEELVWLFGEYEDGRNKKRMYTKELTEIIVEKLKNDLISNNIGSELPEVTKDKKPPTDKDITLKLWIYRLFYNPKDEIVRKGDIVKSKFDDKLYLILSSDCHLNKFWSKNLGFLQLIPLRIIHSTNTDLLKDLQLSKSDSDLKNKMVVSSIVNFSEFESCSVLPIEIDGKINFYFLNAREIISRKIISNMEPKIFEQNKRNLKLRYKYFDDFEYENRITISEPFLTTLIQHLLSKITHYGASDYSGELEEAIQESFNKMFEK